MKVLLIGATGVLGRHVSASLRNYDDLEVITASRTGDTDLRVDIALRAQIEQMYWQVGPVDAVINVAGHCHLGPFDDMAEEDFYLGIRAKLMGQINLVMVGKNFVVPGGSFTLTSGFLSDDPIRGSVGYAVANGGIDNFVLAASAELAGRQRVNAVSPGWVVDRYDGRMDHPTTGVLPIPIDTVVHAYYKSAFGMLSGQVFRVWEPSTQYVRK